MPTPPADGRALPAPRQPLQHLPVLDGLRGLAILSVLVYHADQDHFDQRWLPGGFLGVDLFFVLSGFLITTLLLQEAAATDGLALRRFWARRMRRLLPAAWVMVVPVTALLAALSPDRSGAIAVGGVESLGYVTNASPVLPGDHPFELAHLWSLAVEEQFYLLWPLVLLACLRLRLGPAALWWATAATVLLVVTARAVLDVAGAGWRVTYLATPLHCDGLLVGALLAQARAADRLAPWARAGRRLRVPLLVLVAAELVLLSQFGDAAYLYGISVFVLAAGLLVAGLVEDDCSRTARLLRTPVLQWLGLRSYSLYLWSLPAEYLLDRVPALDSGSPVALLVVAAVLVALSEASYRLVEHRFRVRAPEPGTARGAVPAAAPG